jgi:hypothetical protein
MNYQDTYSLTFFVCVVALLVGCQSSDALSEQSSEAAIANAPAGEPSIVPTASEVVAADSRKNGETSPKAPVAQFSPPFPDRTELFEPPKRAASMTRRDEEHGETVELKGFINVDRPRVVLSIDGVVSPVAEGGEKYGVQVISIQPPSVVLQRGRSRWTATLE